MMVVSYSITEIYLVNIKALLITKLYLNSLSKGENKLEETVSYAAKMLNRNKILWDLILDLLGIVFVILEYTFNVYTSQFVIYKMRESDWKVSKFLSRCKLFLNLKYMFLI